MKQDIRPLESFTSISGRTPASSVIEAVIVKATTDGTSQNLEGLGWPVQNFRFPMILGPVIEYKEVGWPDGQVIDLAAYERSKDAVSPVIPAQR